MNAKFGQENLTGSAEDFFRDVQVMGNRILY